MNYNGVVRRIDSLGRIVIPKEIRNKLRIKDNESMEFSIENDSIILKKYTILNDFEKNILNYGNLLHELTNKNIIITNREKIIYSTNLDLLNKEISDILSKYLLNRDQINIKDNLEIIKNIFIISSYYGLPIIFNSDVIGLIIVYSENINERDKLILNIINKILVYSLNYS